MARPSESFGPNEASNVPTEDAYARYARSLGIADGVVSASRTSFDSGSLRVTANGSANVTVASGEANVCGVWYRNSLAFTVPIPPNTGSTPRIDAVVVRMDNTIDEVSVIYVKGTSIEPPPLQDFGVKWDIQLALVTVAGGASTVAAGGVQDSRAFVSPGTVRSNTGAHYQKAWPGQIQVRPGNRVLLGQEDGSWEQIYPEPDPTWIYMDFPSEGEIRDYNAGAGSGFYHPAYARFPGGQIRLRGLAESVSGTAPDNVVIARLPVGFRTGATMVFPAWSSAGAARITINGDDNATDSGKIRIADGLASGGWISLDGITFWSAQA